VSLLCATATASFRYPAAAYLALTPALAAVIGWENALHVAAVLWVVAAVLWLGIDSQDRRQPSASAPRSLPSRWV
jgi:cyanate permease